MDKDTAFESYYSSSREARESSIQDLDSGGGVGIGSAFDNRVLESINILLLFKESEVIAENLQVLYVGPCSIYKL